MLMGILIAYVAGVAIMLVIGFGFYMVNEDKLAARVVLISPVWPLFFPFAIYKAVKALWKEADWRNYNEDY